MTSKDEATNRRAAGISDEVVERYVLGLLVEETGEVNQWIGKALRFGMNTPGKLNADGNVSGETPRTLLPAELGDVLAAVEFSLRHGIFDREAVEAARDKKLAKLCNPEARDNLGRQLAPQPAALQPASLARETSEPVAWPGEREQVLLSKIANALFANREANAMQHEHADELRAEIKPHLEALGLTDEGDGWGFSTESLEALYASPALSKQADGGEPGGPKNAMAPEEAAEAVWTTLIDALSPASPRAEGTGHWSDPKTFEEDPISGAEPDTIAALRHECAKSGPCSENGDGCTCSVGELVNRHNFINAANSPDAFNSGVEAAASMVAALRDDSRQEPMGFTEIAERIRKLQVTKGTVG